MGHIAAARGTLYMLSVRPREQQVAEKPLLKLIFSKTIRFPIFNFILEAGKLLHVNRNIKFIRNGTAKISTS